MAYVPGFLHDLFLSYASADDAQGGLIREFWRLLTDALRAQGLPLKENDPAGVDVFLDRRRLQAGSDLSEQLLSSARGSAVFIAFHSLAYMESSWCTREATEFCSIYDERWPRLNGRLFVVALGKQGAPPQSNVELLRSRQYRRFYYLNENGEDFPFAPETAGLAPPKNEQGRTLAQEAISLAREIAPTLRDMRKQSPTPVVFLADTSDARRSQADDIKNGLVQAQTLVLRASPQEAEWEEQSRALIAKADLFVDLHESTPSAAGIAQARIASELKKPRVRWLPRGEMAPADTQAVLAETKLVEETLENFKEELRRMLTQPGERYKVPAPTPGNADASSNAAANALVLLVAASKDEPRITQIERVLDQIGCGRDAFVSEDVVTMPDTWRNELQERLEYYPPAGVVFVDGDCSGPWADKRLRDLVMLLRDAAPRARTARCSFPTDNKPRRYAPPKALVLRLDETQLDRLRELL